MVSRTHLIHLHIRNRTKLLFSSSVILLALILGSCSQSGPLLTPGKFVHTPGPNPIITDGPDSEWDGNVVEMSDILKLNGTYYIFYHGHGFEGEYNRYNIGLALSSDPIGPWGKSAGNPILTAGAPGEWDDSNIACAAVLKIGDTYYMWYSAMQEYPQWDIGLATAPAPAGPWKKYERNPVMEDFGYVGGVVRVDDKYYLYANYPLDPDTDLGPLALAIADAPEGPYTRYEGNPVLAAGPEGSWDDAGFSESKVVYYDNMYHLFYSGTTCPNPENLYEHRTSVGYAYSPNGLSFTKYEENLVATYSTNPDCFKLSEARTLIEFPLIYIYTSYMHGESYEKVEGDIGVQTIEVLE